MTGALYVGDVLHRRLRPASHSLKYGVYMLHADLDHLDELHRTSRLLSVNRWNLLSFHEADHGPAGEGTLASRIRRLAGERGLAWDGAGLTLIAMPRLFGFVFNPLSVYFCRNADGRLAAIVYEVRTPARDWYPQGTRLVEDFGEGVLLEAETTDLDQQILQAAMAVGPVHSFSRRIPHLAELFQEVVES